MAMNAVVVGGDADEIYVLPLTDLERVRGWHVPALVVVDAAEDVTPTLAMLARLVLLRRRLRAAGGNLVVVASPAVAEALRSNGLHWAIPMCDELSQARDAVRDRRA